MAIHVDVLASINQRQVDKEGEKLARSFDNYGAIAGERFGNQLTGELARVSPKVQKALHGVQNAADATQRSMHNMENASDRSATAFSTLQTAGDRVAKTLQSLEAILNDTSHTEEQAEKASLAYAAACQAEEAAIKALERAKRSEADATRAGERARRNEADAVRAAGLAIKAAVADHKNFASQMDKTRIAGKSLYVGMTELTTAVNNSRHTMVNGANAFTDSRTRIQKLAESANHAVESLRGLGTSAMQTARGIGAVSIPAVVGFLYETAQVAVTASQSLLLLPAAAAAGATAFGTLQLATQGFSEALKDIRDPTKFAEDIAKLSPAAQQAALSIRGIMPELDRLQQAAQEAFFTNFGEKFQQLSQTFAPSIQQLTTNVAGSFNQGATGIFDTLMSSGNQANISTIMDNISAAFQNAAPAAKQFTDALLQLTEVGSTFLPDIGTAISTVAGDFAQFISENAASGDLQKWIQEGIDAVVILGGAIKDVGTFIYDVFGNTSKEDMERWRGSLQDILSVAGALLKVLGGTIDILDTKIPGINEGFLEMSGIINQMAKVIEGIRWFLDPNYNPTEGPFATATANAEAKAREAINEKRRSEGKPPLGPNDPLDTVTLQGAGEGPKPGDRYTVPLQSQRHGLGGSLTAGHAISGWNGSMYDLGAPGASTTGKAPKESDKDRRDRIGNQLDPSLYAVDPNNPMGPMPGGGYSSKQQGVLKAEHDVMSDTRDLEDARKARLILERDNLATDREIEDAKWKELEAGWNLQESQAKLIEKQTGNTKDLKDGMDKLGAALDPDFGLSKGLAGFVENLTKFIGNILFMPTAMKLQQTVNADPIKGGHGLLGILGAQNLAAGNSPLLGNPVPGGTGYENAYATAGLPGLISAGQTPGITPTLGGLPGTTDAIAGAPLAPVAGLPGTHGPQGAVAPGRFSGTGAPAPGQAPGGSYGLPSNTDTGGYGSGGKGIFPDWVQQLGAAFNVKPSTYAGHQDTDRHEAGYAANPNHENRGIDWSGTPADMQKFADYLKNVPGMEQVIWNGGGIGTGDTVEIAGGRPQPGYFADDLAGHGNHVHTRQSSPIPLPASAGGAPALPWMTGSGGTGGPPGQGPGMFGPANLAPSGAPQELPFSLGGMGAPGMPGESPLLGAGGMIGGGAQQPFTAPHTIGGGLIGGAQQGPTRIGGNGGPTNNQGGGPGIGITPGGSLETAMSIAGAGLDMLAPGAGQAAQIGLKEGSRAIQYAGQVAGIATQGIMDTFLPTGGSELASNSWFTRILGGLAGATPAIPNTAGGAAAQNGAQPPLTPEQALTQHMGNGQGSPGPGNNITVNTNQEPEGVKLGNTISFLNQASNTRSRTP